MTTWDPFIAYASPDRAHAEALHGELQRRGRRPFLDLHGIAPGADWDDVLLAALDGAPTVLVLVSAATRDAQYQRGEIARVCRRDARGRKRVIPVLLADVDLPYGLETKQALRWSTAREVADSVFGAAADDACPFIVGPSLHDDAMFVGRSNLCSVLLDSIDRGHSSQLVGERRMGKTSLLLWLKRHLPQTERKIALVDVSGLAAATPWELLLDIGRQVGAEPQLRTLKELGQSATQALSKLPRTAALIDEADHLAAVGHTFDPAFFEEWRRLGQTGHLVWVSASHRNLGPRFASTGLTSRFLNDATEREVGPLEPDGVPDLLGVLGEEAVAWGREVSGDVGIVAQAVGRVLWGGRAPSEEALFDVIDQLRAPVFEAWRRDREPDELAALHAGDRALTEKGRLARRRMVRRGIWPVTGSAWQWWLINEQ